jgi:hypothetical protein
MIRTLKYHLLKNKNKKDLLNGLRKICKKLQHPTNWRHTPAYQKALLVGLKYHLLKNKVYY